MKRRWKCANVRVSLMDMITRHSLLQLNSWKNNLIRHSVKSWCFSDSLMTLLVQFNLNLCSLSQGYAACHISHVPVVAAEFDRKQRCCLCFSERQPLIVSVFLCSQTGWLRLSRGESALVSPKIWPMTHTYEHFTQVQPMLSKSIDFSNFYLS